jgi:hypothetical protein
MKKVKKAESRGNTVDIQKIRKHVVAARNAMEKLDQELMNVGWDAQSEHIVSLSYKIRDNLRWALGKF